MLTPEQFYKDVSTINGMHTLSQEVVTLKETDLWKLMIEYVEYALLHVETNEQLTKSVKDVIASFNLNIKEKKEDG